MVLIELKYVLNSDFKVDYSQTKDVVNNSYYKWKNKEIGVKQDAWQLLIGKYIYYLLSHIVTVEAL